MWHLARHPLAVIASWAASDVIGSNATPFGRFIRCHVPDVAAEATPVARAARWVAEWNLRGRRACEALDRPYRLTRLEDEDPTGAGRVNGSVRDLDPVTWEQVAAEATAETAEMLGTWAYVAGYDQ